MDGDGDGELTFGGAEFWPCSGASCRKAVTETVTTSDTAPAGLGCGLHVGRLRLFN
jgi:hypothetical protein